VYYGRREMNKQEMLEHILKYMDQDMEWAVDHYHQAILFGYLGAYQGMADYLRGLLASIKEEQIR
jgi:hypothetical protein